MSDDFDFSALELHEEPKAEIVDPLNEDEYHELETLEETIEAGLTTFIQVGNALAEIRDKRLYREDFATFEDYCRDRWEISRPRSYQLIGAAEVVENLSTMVDKAQLPTSERQVRPLTKLKPEQQREAYQEAVETAPKGKVTGTHVQRVVEKYMPKPEPDDYVGNASIGALEREIHGWLARHGENRKINMTAICKGEGADWVELTRFLKKIKIVFTEKDLKLAAVDAVETRELARVKPGMRDAIAREVKAGNSFPSAAVASEPPASSIPPLNMPKPSEIKPKPAVKRYTPPKEDKPDPRPTPNYILNTLEEEITTRLKVIREDKLYEPEYESFKEYCFVRFGISEARKGVMIYG